MDSIQNDGALATLIATKCPKDMSCRSEKQRIANYFLTMVRNARSITAKCSIGGKFSPNVGARFRNSGQTKSN